MKVMIMDGSDPRDPMANSVGKKLMDTLRQRGDDVMYFKLSDLKAPNEGERLGDIFSLVKAPRAFEMNRCRRMLAEELECCDRLILMTPLEYEGYSCALRISQDQRLQCLTQYFDRINQKSLGERSKQKEMNLTVLGWIDAPEPRKEAYHRLTISRNMLRLKASENNCSVFYSNQSAEKIEKKVKAVLQETEALLLN